MGRPGGRGAGVLQLPLGKENGYMGAAGLLSPQGTQAEIKAHGFSLLCADVEALERASLQPVVI